MTDVSPEHNQPRVISVLSWYLTSLVNLAFCSLDDVFPFPISASIHFIFLNPMSGRLLRVEIQFRSERCRLAARFDFLLSTALCSDACYAGNVSLPALGSEPRGFYRYMGITSLCLYNNTRKRYLQYGKLYKIHNVFLYKTAN